MLLNLKKVSKQKQFIPLQLIDSEVLKELRDSFKREELEARRKELIRDWCLASGLITIVITPFIINFILSIKTGSPDVFSSGFSAGIYGSLLFVVLLGGLTLYQRTLSKELRDLEREYE